MLEKASSPDKSRSSLILKWLKSGKTREETAAALGYKSWRGLDIFMRRQGMRWDSSRNTYYVPEETTDTRLKLVDNTPAKIAMIISKFNQRDADPMEIARQEGFSDHRQLSSYMLSRGYEWSDDSNNYVKSYKAPKPTLKAEAEAEEDTGDMDDDIAKFMPFFKELFENRDKLLEILHQSSTTGEIPRYIVPGVTRTKSFYMSDTISRLICEFSQRRNISQKEIIEAALIEFLRKYSFKDEVDSILGKE